MLKISTKENINFRQNTMLRASLKSKGSLCYKTSSLLSPLKSALKEIQAALSKIGNIEPDKIKKVLKDNIVIKNGLILSSVLGTGSSIKLVINNDNDKREFLDVEARENGKIKSYRIENNNIIKGIDNNEYYTQQDLNDKNIEQELHRILSATDLPLLNIRQGLNRILTPSVERPYFIKMFEPETEITPNVVQGKNLKEESKTDETPKEKQVKTGLKKSPKPNHINTETEVDKILLQLLFRTAQTPKKISKDVNVDTGKLSANVFKILDDINILFDEINKIYLEQENIPRVLSKRFSKFDSIKRNNSISLKNIDGSGLNISFFKSTNKIHQQRPILTIFKKDSEGNIIDILPIDNGRVHKMQKGFKFEHSGHFMNYISNSKFLSQDELDSKNLPQILGLLKEELSKMLCFIKEGGGKIGQNGVEKLSKTENDLKELRQNLLKDKTKLVKQVLNSDGSFIFKNYNGKGEVFIYLPAEFNTKTPGVTIIRILDAHGKFKEGIAIENGKVANNYPTYNGQKLPKKITFYTQEEIENKNPEEKILKYLEIAQDRINLTKRINDSLVQRKKIKSLYIL